MKGGKPVATLLVVNKSDLDFGKALAGEFDLLCGHDNDLVAPGEFRLFPNHYAHKRFKEDA